MGHPTSSGASKNHSGEMDVQPLEHGGFEYMEEISALGALAQQYNARSLVPLVETLCAMRYSAIHSGSAGEPI
jgi:hypothetical protein